MVTMAPLGRVLLQLIIPDDYQVFSIPNSICSPPPPTLLFYQASGTSVVTVDKQLIARDEFLEEVKQCLLQAQVT
jgi:hypothetical protein